MEIKICGIRNLQEIAYVNEAGIEYAGFVLYKKSKRYIELGNAKKLFKKLNDNIRKVAVTVLPDIELIKQVEDAGFDILQVHGELSDTEWWNIQKSTGLPIWRAVNVSEQTLQPNEVRRITGMGETLTKQQTDRDQNKKENVSGILFDAKNYGSGKTFDWELFGGGASEAHYGMQNAYYMLREDMKENKIKFILAGGLHAENVIEGIRIFRPDIVDVSSGVEGIEGKDRAKILEFVRRVRNARY